MIKQQLYCVLSYSYFCALLRSLGWN